MCLGNEAMLYILGDGAFAGATFCRIIVRHQYRFHISEASCFVAVELDLTRQGIASLNEQRWSNKHYIQLRFLAENLFSCTVAHACFIESGPCK